MIGMREEPRPGKTLFFPRVSGQLLSLLYQDPCPTIRPITFDSPRAPARRAREILWGELLFPALIGARVVALSSTPSVYTGKGTGGQSHLQITWALTLAVWDAFS